MLGYTIISQFSRLVRSMARLCPLSIILFFGGCERNDPVGFVTLGDGSAYLMAHFRGDGSEGLFYSYSLDGYNWVSLNREKPALIPQVGSKLMRDPSILHTDDGLYHLVWTSGWRDRSIGYANSRDLVNWSEQKSVPVMVYQAGAKNAWAPSLAFDSQKREFLILWSTTIPGQFADTDFVNGDGEIWNHRLYSARTHDFVDLKEPGVFYDPGYSVIDGCVSQIDNEYVLLFKNETEDPPEKNIRIAFSKTIEGPYESVAKPITGKGYWAEGPALTTVGEDWVVYFDKYREQKYGAAMSKDLRTWSDVSASVNFPAGVRHGGVLIVTRDMINALLAWTAE